MPYLTHRVSLIRAFLRHERRVCPAQVVEGHSRWYRCPPRLDQRHIRSFDRGVQDAGSNGVSIPSRASRSWEDKVIRVRVGTRRLPELQLIEEIRALWLSAVLISSERSPCAARRSRVAGGRVASSAVAPERHLRRVRSTCRAGRRS